MPPPRPAPTCPAGSRRSLDGRSVRPSPPVYVLPPSGRFCPRPWAPLILGPRHHEALVYPPPSPGAGNNCPRTSDSIPDTDYSSGPTRSPRSSSHPPLAHPCWLSLADRLPKPPTSRYQTACPVISVHSPSSSRRTSG